MLYPVTLNLARLMTHVTGATIVAQSMDDRPLCPGDGQEEA